jgi:hypothetical protein
VVSSETKIMLWLFRWPCLALFVVLLLLAYPAPWGKVVLTNCPIWSLLVLEGLSLLEVLASFA